MQLLGLGHHQTLLILLAGLSPNHTTFISEHSLELVSIIMANGKSQPRHLSCPRLLAKCTYTEPLPYILWSYTALRPTEPWLHMAAPALFMIADRP